jgi:hypothetical protein
MAQTALLQNPQEFEVVVSGPGTANRLFVCSGVAQFGVGAQAGSQTEVVTFLVGPTLTQAQFQRAAVSVGLTDFRTIANQGFQSLQVSWTIASVDADWDDESGRVEVEVETVVTATAALTNAFVGGLSYHVTILAAF